MIKIHVHNAEFKGVYKETTGKHRHWVAIWMGTGNSFHHRLPNKDMARDEAVAYALAHIPSAVTVQNLDNQESV